MGGKLYILTISVVALGGVNLFFILQSPPSQGGEYLSAFEPAFDSTEAYVLPVVEPSYYPILNSNVQRPSLNGTSAIIYSVGSSRVLFAKNADVRLPIASVTKVLSALVARDLFAMDEVVTVPSSAVRVDEEQQELYVNEEIAVGSLIKLMLVKSSNDAAYALAAHAQRRGIDFVGRMNEKARELSMRDSHFLDPAGLNNDGYATAHDLAMLFSSVLRERDLWDVSLEREVSVTSWDGKITHRAENTNQLLDEFPNIVGGKTGFTTEAQGSMVLMVAVPAGHDTIISVVLNSPTRFEDTRQLIGWVLNAYRWQ